MKELRVLFAVMSASNVAQLTESIRRSAISLTFETVNANPALEAALDGRKWDVILYGAQPELTLTALQASLRIRSLDIPVIIMRASAGTMDLASAMQSGAQDCLDLNDAERLVPTIHREMVSATMRHNLREQVVTDYLMQEIDQMILLGCDAMYLVNKICQRLVELFSFKLVWIGMKVPDGRIESVAAAGTTDYVRSINVRWDDTPEGRGGAGISIRTNKPVTIRVSDPRFAHWRARAEQYGIQSGLALPLGIKNEVVGTLLLYSEHEDTFDPLTVSRLSAFAGRVTVAMLGAQEQQGLRLMEAAMNYAANAMFITRNDGAIEWVNEAVNRYSGYSVEELIGQNPRIFASGQHDQAFWKGLWDAALGGKIWRGDIINRHKEGGLYTVAQTVSPLFDGNGDITHFLAIQQDITEKKKLEQEIRHLAYHDTLTGLPNRMLFQDRVQLSMIQAQRNDETLALLFLDLDGFKAINDQHGHAVGDELLKQVAARLQGCVRAGDTVARLGGDEFTVMLCNVGGAENARQIASKILERIRQPYWLENGQHGVISVSIGISLYPQDAEGFDELLTDADNAMYRAKQGGKNRLAFFSANDDESMLAD